VAKSTTQKHLTAGQTKKAIHHCNIQTAYLNGDLTQKVYIKQSEGYLDGNEENVSKPLKNIYV
jgi:hypothetical protein